MLNGSERNWVKSTWVAFGAWRGLEGRAAIRLDSSWVWASAHFFRIRLQCHLCHVRSVIIHFYIHIYIYILSQSALSLALPLFLCLSSPVCPFFVIRLKRFSFLFNFNWLERLLLPSLSLPQSLSLSLFAMQIYSWITFKSFIRILYIRVSSTRVAWATR